MEVEPYHMTNLTGCRSCTKLDTLHCIIQITKNTKKQYFQNVQFLFQLIEFLDVDSLPDSVLISSGDLPLIVLATLAYVISNKCLMYMWWTTMSFMWSESCLCTWRFYSLVFLLQSFPLLQVCSRSGYRKSSCPDFFR